LAGEEADARLRDVRDDYVWFVEELEEFLAESTNGSVIGE